jgi:hypothetical protein
MIHHYEVIVYYMNNISFEKEKYDLHANQKKSYLVLLVP